MEIQIHRFHDKVAFALLPNAKNGTVYLNDVEAQQLGESLVAYATNVRMSKFTDSEIGTATIEIENTR